MEVYITPLGLTLLATGYLITFIALYIAREGNAPDSRIVNSLRSLVLGKIFFAIMLAMLASSPQGGGGLSGLVNVVAEPARALGPGYFIVSMVMDMVLVGVFYRMEFYKAFIITLANIVYLPFVNAVAGLVAKLEQLATINKVKRDVMTDTKHHSVVIGTVSKSVRLVEQPVRTADGAQLKTHVLVKRIPGNIPVMYCPVIGEREFNPHVIIAGSSGTGKTTTLYSLIKQLIEHYPVILLDVKGDFTQAFYEEGYVDSRKAEIIFLSHVGVDPFKPVVDNESEVQMVEDLMDSISVLEEVGSKQAHFIRTAWGELRYSNKKLTYENLVWRIEVLHQSALEGVLKYGPQTRDAIEGIYDKLSDLRMVFKSSGIGLREVYSRLLEEGGPPLVILNISDIPEKIRAIVLEFLLRKLAKVMHLRGPLAFREGRPVVTVIDEAYIVAKPILQRGRDAGSRSKLEDIARTARSYGLALIIATQRLSDISDGIRQNCYRWIIFNTPSPEDTWVLEHTVPSSILKVLGDLEKGEAYIRFVFPGRMQSLSRQDPSRIIVDGYIFEMKREYLAKDIERKGKEPAKPLTICRVCGRVLTTNGECVKPHLTKQEEKTEEPQEAVEEVRDGETSLLLTKAKQRDVETSSKQEGNVNREKIDSELFGRVLRAIEKVPSPETRQVLRKIPLAVLAEFARDWRNKDFAGEFQRYGLLTVKNGKLLKTIAGRVFLKMFEGDENGGE